MYERIDLPVDSIIVGLAQKPVMNKCISFLMRHRYAYIHDRPPILKPFDPDSSSAEFQRNQDRSARLPVDDLFLTRHTGGSFDRDLKKLGAHTSAI